MTAVALDTRDPFADVLGTGRGGGDSYHTLPPVLDDASFGAAMRELRANPELVNSDAGRDTLRALGRHAVQRSARLRERTRDLFASFDIDIEDPDAVIRGLADQYISGALHGAEPLDPDPYHRMYGQVVTHLADQLAALAYANHHDEPNNPSTATRLFDGDTDLAGYIRQTKETAGPAAADHSPLSMYEWTLAMVDALTDRHQPTHTLRRHYIRGLLAQQTLRSGA